MLLKNTLRIGIMAAALSALPLAAQDQQHNAPGTSNQTFERQAQGNQVGNANPANAPTTNPGFGSQVPNDATGYRGPQDNSTYQKDRNGNTGVDLGWLGLLGLGGLFGLRRSPGRLEQAEGHHPHNAAHVSRT